MSHSIELVALENLNPNPLNPKSHDNVLINKSFSAFGYIDPIVVDERTNYMISGHGRHEVLKQMKESNQPAPTGVVVKNGKWFVPIVKGWASKDDTEARAALVALNRTNERGGWDNENLFTILQELLESDKLDSVGFLETDVLMLERALEAENVFTQDLSKAIDEFINETGVDMEGRVAHYSTVLRVYFQTEESRQEFFELIKYQNEGKKQASIRYPATFARETAEQWQG